MCLEPEHQNKEKKGGWSMLHTFAVHTVVFFIMLTILINVHHG